MILAIIAVALLGIGSFVFAGLSTNAKSKKLDIIFSIIACVCLLAFGVALVFLDNVQDKAIAAEAAKIETSEGEQKLEIVPIDTSANITITTESMTDEQLIKAFIEKWDGVLPDTIIINVGGADNELS